MIVMGNDGKEKSSKSKDVCASGPSASIKRAVSNGGVESCDIGKRNVPGFYFKWTPFLQLALFIAFATVIYVVYRPDLLKEEYKISIFPQKLKLP